MDQRRSYQVRLAWHQGGICVKQGLGTLALPGVPQQQIAQKVLGLASLIPDDGEGHILRVAHIAVQPPLLQGGSRSWRDR